MNTVTVGASTKYDVIIGSGLLRQAGIRISAVCKAKKAAIVSDSNVWPLYGSTVSYSLRCAGLDVVHFVIPSGERSKNGQIYLELLNFLAENHLTRSDCLIALGGGVTGDLTGFAAATYLRGIPYVQIPTTLLAAVDSSVGGKTAIDLPAGKNLAGAFYQPVLVICDTDTLSTLPEDVFRDGCAEVIKYGVLYDPALFSHLQEHGTGFDRQAVITRCVELKRDVVMEDEYDTGARMKLNLGHTFGHGVEARSNFRVSHGNAVAIGMAIAARGSKCTDADRILSCLSRFALPTTIDYPAEDILHYALSDKKRSGDLVNLIIPRCIGCCDIVPTPVDQLITFIKEGM